MKAEYEIATFGLMWSVVSCPVRLHDSLIIKESIDVLAFLYGISECTI